MSSVTVPWLCCICSEAGHFQKSQACCVYDASEGHQRAFREMQGCEVTVHAVQQRGPPPALGVLCYNCGKAATDRVKVVLHVRLRAGRVEQ